MRIIIAPDSFKECAAAPRVAEAIAAGLRRVWPTAELVLLPLADGGEGTVEVLLAVLGGRRIQVTVEDPLGRPVEACYGLLGDGRTEIEAAVQMGSVAISRLPGNAARQRELHIQIGTNYIVEDWTEPALREMIAK